MKIERINDWFARQGRWMVQKRWLVLSLFILVFAIGFTGLRYFKVSASWENYFLEDDPMLVKTKEFKDIFGNDNFAAVLTQCDNSFMKENLELIRELTNEMMDSISYADKITSLTDIEFMVGNEEGMTIEQIVPDLIPTDAASLETMPSGLSPKMVRSRGLFSSCVPFLKIQCGIKVRMPFLLKC